MNRLPKHPLTAENPFVQPVCSHCQHLASNGLPSSQAPKTEWGRDGLIETAPGYPGETVRAANQRDLLHAALSSAPAHDPSHTDAAEAGAPGSLAEQAASFLAGWTGHDETFYLLLTNSTWAQMCSDDIQAIFITVDDYLAYHGIVGYSPAHLREAVREIYQVAAALDLTRCQNGTNPSGPIWGVPALVTAACAERLYDRFPTLIAVDDSDYLYWVAHLTLWCHLNGSYSEWEDTLAGNGA